MKLKKYLPAIIVAGAAILALIFALILSGAVYKFEESVIVATVSGTSEVSLIGLMFGSPTIVTTIDGEVSETAITGGMSIFGLISFIALIAGIALTVASVFVKGKKLDLIGSALVALAGILVFFLLAAGTDITNEVLGKTVVTEFTEAFEEYKLGAGAIIYGIIATLGGCFGVVNCFKKIV